METITIISEIKKLSVRLKNIQKYIDEGEAIKKKLQSLLKQLNNETTTKTSE